MRLRRLCSADAEAVTRLFYRSVHELCRGEYTPLQLDAWASADIDPASWTEPLLYTYTLVADDEGEIIGFGNIDGHYVDRLFVSPSHAGRGVGRTILMALESKARDFTTVYASDTAKHFFEHMGYRVIRGNHVQRFSVSLCNWYMRKEL